MPKKTAEFLKITYGKVFRSHSNHSPQHFDFKRKQQQQQQKKKHFEELLHSFEPNPIIRLLTASVHTCSSDIPTQALNTCIVFCSRLTIGQWIFK